MENIWTTIKTGAVLALLVLVFVGGPIWGATGSLSHAWHAVKQYSKIMGWLVLIGGGLGLIAAITG